MGIKLVELQREAGLFVTKNATALQDELTQVDEMLRFNGESLEKNLPVLAKLVTIAVLPTEEGVPGGGSNG